MTDLGVRDVAAPHLRAMTGPAAAGERFLAIAGHSLRLVDSLLVHGIGNMTGS